MNKKAIIGDLGTYILALFLMAVVILILGYAVLQINTSWQGNDGIPAIGKTIFGDYANRFTTSFDNFYMILVLGYLIVTLIIAFALRSNPAFAWFAFILMMILGIISVYLSNVFFGLATTGALSSTAEQFTKMNFFAQRLPFVVVIIGIVFIIILYAKSNNSGGQI
jgi:hypothetical protein